MDEFDESRNHRTIQALDKVMNVERPIETRANGSMSSNAVWTDMTPTQAGLSAALRRVFLPECDEISRKFDELLAQLN